jgi:hypothetical protein
MKCFAHNKLDSLTFGTFMKYVTRKYLLNVTEAKFSSSFSFACEAYLMDLPFSTL